MEGTVKRKVKKPKKIKLNGKIIKIEEAEMDEKSREERGRNISLKVAVGMTCSSPRVLTPPEMAEKN